MTERDGLLDLGSAALARGDWRAAHEHWEDAWRISAPPERDAAQALAQLAAALVHVARGGRRGAASVLGKAERRLAPASPAALGAIDIAAVRRLIAMLRAELAAGAAIDLAAIRERWSRDCTRPPPGRLDDRGKDPVA